MITNLKKEIPLPNGKSLIIFDVDCLLCNRAVLMLLFWARNDHFLIAARNSNGIMGLLGSDNILTGEDSVILISGNMAYTKADAVKRIALHLNYLILPVAATIWIIPNILLNKAYDFIAKNRGLLGNKAKCEILYREKLSHKIYVP